MIKSNNGSARGRQRKKKKVSCKGRKKEKQKQERKKIIKREEGRDRGIKVFKGFCCLDQIDHNTKIVDFTAAVLIVFFDCLVDNPTDPSILHYVKFSPCLRCVIILMI